MKMNDSDYIFIIGIIIIGVICAYPLFVIGGIDLIHDKQLCYTNKGVYLGEFQSHDRIHVIEINQTIIYPTCYFDYEITKGDEE